LPDPKQLPSWDQYGFHAMSEMERFSRILVEMDTKIDRIEAAQISAAGEAKGSAKTWGTVTGFAVVALVEAVKAVFSTMFGHPK